MSTKRIFIAKNIEMSISLAAKSLLILSLCLSTSSTLATRNICTEAVATSQSDAGHLINRELQLKLVPSISAISEMFDKKNFNGIMPMFIPSMLSEISTKLGEGEFSQTYNQGLLSRLGVESLSEYKLQNPKIAEGIEYYVADPAQMNEPYWELLNRKLRANEKLSEEEAKVFSKMKEGTAALPKVSGIVFRGRKILPAKFEIITEGSTITDPAFVSTSFHPQVAERFAKIYPNQGEEGKIELIYIILAKEAAPVSAFVEEYQGEVEALIMPGASFLVHKKLHDPKSNRAFIFMSQQ